MAWQCPCHACLLTQSALLLPTQELRLEAVLLGMPGVQQPPFDSAVVGSLPHLHRLELATFGLLRLEHLPASLRTLHIRGSGICVEDDEQQPFVFSLPEHCW